jgi:tape measure domain-containing protein
MSKVGGEGALSFSAGLDIEPAKKNAEELKKILKDLKIQSSEVVAGIGKAGGMDTKPISNYQQAQLALQKSLADARVEVQRLIQVNQALKNELEQGKIASQARRTEVERLKIAEQELKNAFAQGKIGLQEYNKQVEANKVAQGELNQKLTEAAIKDKQAAAALKEHALEQKKIAEEARKAKKAAQEVAGSYNEAKRRLAELGAEIRSTNNGFKSQTPELRAKIKEYNELNDGLKKFDATMGNHQRNVGNYGGALRGAANDLASMATAYLSAGQALQFVFQSTLEFNKIKNPLTFILGSEGDALNKLSDLKQMAQELGLDYFALAESYKSFTGAARASNFDLDKSEKIFRSVAKAGAVLGLSSDQMSGSLLALQQMISKGNVQAEELRGQLSERLPGAFSLAAKAMGVTEQELNKLLESGSVVASDMLPKLADQLDKAYGNKASDGIKGLNAELNGLKTALQSLAGEGSALSTNIFEPIIRGAKNAALELSQFFRGSFTENIRYALTFSNKSLAEQRKAYDLRDSNKNNASALQAAQKKDVGLMSLGELRNTYSQINETYKQAVRDYKAFENGVKNGTLKESGDKTVKSFFKLAEGLHAERERVGEELKKIKGQQVQGNKEIADSALTAIADIKKRITQLQKLPGSADQGGEIAKRIEALQARLKKSGGATTVKAEETALKRQRTLQAEIDALTRKGVASKEAADEQEIVSVEEKYRKLREKAIAFNNAKDSKGQKVNASGLNAAEAADKLEIRQKAESKVLAKSLDEQQKYYAEFEDLKGKIGEQKAKERYANLIDVDKTYLESLEAQYDQLTIGKAKGGSEEGAEANPFAMKLLNEQIAAARIVQQKADDERYAQALQAATTHAQALEAIDREYWANRKALGDGATDEQIANLDRLRAEAIRNANETNAYLKGGYDELMQNYDAMTREQIRKRLEAIKDGYRKEYQEGKLTAEQFANLSGPIDDGIAKLDGNNSIKKITTAIKNYREQVAMLGKDSEGAKAAQQAMFDAMAQGAADINEVLGELAGSLEQLGIGGEGLQRTFKNVMGAVDGIGKIGKGLATGNPVDVVTGSIKLLTSAIDLFNTKDRKLQKKIDGYKQQLDSLGKSYTELDRAVNNSVGESFYTDSAKQIANLRAQQALLTQMRDAEARKKKADKGKIAEYNAELDEIPNKIAEINKAISENLIQTNFSQLSQNLADALAEAFASGEDSAKAFDDVFSDVINNAVKNSLKMKILEPIISDFTNELTEYAKKNGNSVIGFDFNKWKDQLRDAGETFTAGLKGSQEFLKDIGLDDRTLTGTKKTGIEAEIPDKITQQQASELAGLYRAQYEVTKQISAQSLVANGLLADGNRVRMDCFAIAKDNLDVAVKIEQNTANTVVELKNVVSRLDKVVTNTSSQSSRALI